LTELTDEEIIELEELQDLEDIEGAQEHLLKFTEYTLEDFEPSPFHKKYYEVLNQFCDKKIKRLIISVPPQHGKSEGSSRRIPPFLLGKNPNLSIALASYNSEFAKKFNRQVQRIIDSKEYYKLFPETSLNSSNVVSVSGSWLRNSVEFEVVNQKGSFKVVGVGGGLTGNKVDVMIMDDLYKDYQDATSPTISESVWDWYTTVVRSRFHNDSQELIVFTRWDENDLVGRLEKKGLVINYDGNPDTIKNLKSKEFLKINFEAIKEGEPTEFDDREKGAALWPSRHDIEKLEETRELDPAKFSALYQGEPRTKEGLMYSDFKTWETLPELKIIKSYTDTADLGKDSLCSIVYGVPVNKEIDKIYIIDLVFTDKGMETTEPLVANLFEATGSRVNVIESNNGGRGFARSVDKQTSNNINIKWFHQSKNKKARIFSNSASVNSSVIMPKGWETKHKNFYDSIANYKKDGSSKHDDGPDCLTGCYEQEFSKKELFIY